MSSVGIDLGPLVRSGALSISGGRREERSSEEHVAWIGSQIRSARPQVLMQVRELILSDRGVALADVFLAGGEVLMGTMRWEREVAERGERSHAAQKLARLQREAESAAAETRARLAALQDELAEREAAIKALRDEQMTTETSFASAQQHLRRLRTADSPAPRHRRRRRNGATEVSR